LHKDILWFADSGQSKETKYFEFDLDFMSFLERMHHILQFDIYRCFLICHKGWFRKTISKRPRITSLRTIMW
jgi:hypothetical protein